MILWLLLSGCDSAIPEREPLETSGIYVPLEGPRLLRRISLDLRGVLPSTEELDAVQADPQQIEAYQNEWLEGDLLEERLVHLLADRWRTRVDVFDIEHTDYAMDDTQEYAFERSVGEEPLRLIAHVITTDRPYTDVVTTDETMANDLLGEIWPLSIVPGESSWRVATYSDGRPPAGILSTNGLWWRHTTTLSNMNRGRAAIISQELLCHDYLDRQVSFSGDESVFEGNENAVHDSPSCQACHASLDPIASALFGFWWVGQYSVEEETVYHGEREPLYRDFVGLAPGLAGQPVDGLQGLGQAIAADPRFSRCAVQSMGEMFWRRPVAAEDRQRVDGLVTVFEDADFRMKAVLREIIEGQRYRAGSLNEEATEADWAREVLARPMGPALLASAIDALTGFEWTYEGFKQMDNDAIGYRVLGGGVDGLSVSNAQLRPGLSQALVWSRLAEAGAATVVESDFLDEEGRLFVGVSLDDRPGDATFDAALSNLYWRLYAERPDADRLSSAAELWAVLEADYGAQTAWAGLLTALLRDPDFLHM